MNQVARPCLALLLLIGCTQPPPTEPAADRAEEKLAFVALTAPVGSLVQHFARSAGDVAVSEPLSQYLIDASFTGGAMAYHPGLARSWTLSEDALELELALRDDNTWHDGRPVSAQDVVFTFERMAEAEMGSRLAGVTTLLADGGVTAPDDSTVRFRFEQPVRLDAALGHLAGVVLLPRHLLSELPAAELRSHAFMRAPVLNGCWKLDSWEPGTQLTLAARPWGNGEDRCSPELDRVVFRVVPEYAARMVELEAGRLDIVPDIRVQDLPSLRAEHPELAFERRGPRSLSYVGWNTRASDGSGPHPLLSDPAVRRALAKAVDVDSIMGDLFGDPSSGEVYAQRAVGITTPALAGMEGENITPLPYEPDAARQALAALGFADSDHDGVLDRDGQPFEIELLVQASASSRAQAGIHIQADLAKVGVKVDLTTLERMAWIERAQQGEFDALLGGWSASLYIDPSATWRSGPQGHYNWTGYANPEVDALIDQGLAAPSAALALEHWRAMQAEVYEDQPYLFLYWADEVVAVSRRLEGVGVGIEAPWQRPERWTSREP